MIFILSLVDVVKSFQFTWKLLFTKHSLHFVCWLFHLNVHSLKLKRVPFIYIILDPTHTQRESERTSKTGYIGIVGHKMLYIFNLKWIKCIKVNCIHLHICYTSFHKLHWNTHLCNIQLDSLDSAPNKRQIIFHYFNDKQFQPLHF